DDVVEAERNVPDEAVKGLRKRGHRIVEPHHPLGGGQAVLIDWGKGTLTGASDPRKDGMALGY
ncbi:MAG: gamma-glutamyltransferase, partial [Mesorhizobium sp.]